MWKAAVSRRFSEKADTYDRYALVQREMAAELAAALEAEMPLTNEVRRVVEVGCGTGGLTSLLRDRCGSAEYLALDIAPGMLEAARRRLGPTGRTCRFVLADVEEWIWKQAEQWADLIVSSACFQWLRQPERTAEGLYRLLRPGGSLLFATFGPRTFWELHDSFSSAYRNLRREPQRHGLSFCTPDEWRAMLDRAGFAGVRIRTREVRLHYPDVRSFLHAVKGIGASTGPASDSAGLGQRRLLTEMMEAYRSRFGGAEGIPVTYELVYVAAERQEGREKSVGPNRQDILRKKGIV
ncbi:malonyl-ACP O-methyltransferase BioC [Brevibacillus aydinogluensis]|uniref:Malonyl-[acyl-carrier protein] O-methyltransferase n=1 Tax=Brevibacillus aydinogluensis TaxID=927786 RepID=A0AA48M460_9BACL|nr:malonyl-ACP O-methyltransferase BioC [Brevibacillus aydinogluensis]NNV01274.1 malonyl-[acyl-carrier protein] O-methyltransferase BioC [Brevibacillus sp. MCWH]REK67980.1 MAG: malonyl-[acyl-carrier protein] O-methyltransferase BioC [Brevibacillus sp.]CAJ1000925.1 malonyl-ACP O-methyltransferase BioC [Brevibacillus aydinogluensis]